MTRTETTGTRVPAPRPPSVATAPRRKTNPLPYFLLLPSVVALLVALAYPVGWQVLTSMREYGLAQQFGQPATFVGLANYVEIFTSDDLWAVVSRSVVFCLVNAIVTLVLGVLLALLLKAVPTWARVVLQVALLLAWAMPLVAAVTVWKWMFDFRTGVVNWLLVRMGFEQFAGHGWLATPLSFFLVATIIIVWMSVPFVALSVYAALTQVSGDVLEAASLDGASRVQSFWLIVLPTIRPVVSVVFLLQIIWDLRVFAQIKLLQDSGAPVGETNLLGTFIYQLGVGSQDFGGAAAVSLFVLALTIVLTWPYVRNLLKEDEA